MCDTCVREGYYGPTEDHECKRCTCVMENTEECNSVSCSLYAATTGLAGYPKRLSLAWPDCSSLFLFRVTENLPSQ